MSGAADLLAAPVPARVAECLAEAASLHRHLCPRQVLGVRMALHAGELLGLDLPRRDDRLFVFVETDGCLADAVSIATGCWLGHRTLRLIDHGKTAATFVDTGGGRAVRIAPHPAARQRAVDLVPDAEDRWHAQLASYRWMPADVLLRSRPVRLLLDVAAIRSRPGRRVVCARCEEDVINERELVRGGAPLCRGCAGEPYYAAREDDP